MPGPPAGIKALAQTGESILVSWLPPIKPNGHISYYTIFSREAGRIGKHTSYTFRAEDSSVKYGLILEIRNLIEDKLYEFWVSATTNVGEGESTPNVVQSPKSRAPSRIASFGQLLPRSVTSKILLPCHSVGNPTPRTMWTHYDMKLTANKFYDIGSDGHLLIRSKYGSIELFIYIFI